MCMTVAFYVRVSTQRQAHTQTIDQQLERLYAAAQAQGEEVHAEQVFRDDGYSRTTRRRWTACSSPPRIGWPATTGSTSFGGMGG